MGFWTIAKREIKSFFVSPIAYVILSIFALVTGVQFLRSMELFDQALQQAKIQAQLMRNPEALSYINLNGMLITNVISFSFFLLFLFMTPAITMRLLAEERSQGTYELLLTSPISTWDIILGKFIAAFVLFMGLIVTQGLFLGVMFGYGNPEIGPVVSGYLGLILSGAAAISIGLFASSLTKNQIIAFFVALFICLSFLMVGWIAGSVSGNLSTFLNAVSVTTHFEEFNKGVMAVSSLVFFISVCVFFLSVAKISVQSLARK